MDLPEDEEGHAAGDADSAHYTSLPAFMPIHLDGMGPDVLLRLCCWCRVDCSMTG